MRISVHSEKMVAFRDYLLKRNPNAEFADRYITYLQSSLVRATIQQVCGNASVIEDVEDIDNLQKIYLVLKEHRDNKRLHNIYSGVVSAYIKFLTGKQLRAMVGSTKENSLCPNE